MWKEHRRRPTPPPCTVSYIIRIQILPHTPTHSAASYRTDDSTAVGITEKVLHLTDCSTADSACWPSACHRVKATRISGRRCQEERNMMVEKVIQPYLG
jgi:hypothetical protein